MEDGEANQGSINVLTSELLDCVPQFFSDPYLADP
jgi:hypothetical protein